jgi:arylsulfatase A-like enzyme
MMRAAARSSRSSLLVVVLLLPSTAWSTNIVLIIADDWAHNDLGCAGHPVLKTPNLDRLAAEGVRFPTAFTPNPICTPSRAAFLTGQDCFTNGCYFFGMPIRESSVHFASVFAKAGYETFYTGKWHNNGRPSRCGFTRGTYIGGGGPGPGGHAHPMVRDFGAAEKRTVDRFDSELFTDAAVEFLETVDKPFLMCVSYMTPHDPWTPPGKYAHLYPPASIPLPANFMPRPMNGASPFRYFTDWHGTNLRDEKQMTPFPRTPAGVRDVRSRYYGTITHDDRQIGRILRKLDARGLRESTLVIFLADHGISLGSHGISGKQTMYEEGIRLPLIVRYPKLERRAATATALVSLIDIFPTICHAAGLVVPPSVEGTSLLGLYQGTGTWGRDRIHAAFVSPEKHRLNSRCIRTSRFKFMQHLTTGETELYDLENDPHELRNLSGRKESATVEKKLAGDLLQWRRRSEPTGNLRENNE